MADTRLMDQAFQRIMRGLVDTGRAPHYAELARALGLPVEEGRALLRGVMQAYPIGWLHPETDYIASFPPLNNLPTQYRITVRGEHRWFAQCGFEATSRPGSSPARPCAWTRPASTAAIRRASSAIWPRRLGRPLRHREPPAHAGRRLPVGVVPAPRGRAPFASGEDRQDLAVLDGHP